MLLYCIRFIQELKTIPCMKMQVNRINDNSISWHHPKHIITGDCAYATKIKFILMNYFTVKEKTFFLCHRHHNACCNLDLTVTRTLGAIWFRCVTNIVPRHVPINHWHSTFSMTDLIWYLNSVVFDGVLVTDKVAYSWLPCTRTILYHIYTILSKLM